MRYWEGLAIVISRYLIYQNEVSGTIKYLNIVHWRHFVLSESYSTEQ